MRWKPAYPAPPSSLVSDGEEWNDLATSLWRRIEDACTRSFLYGWTITEEIGICFLNDYAIARVDVNVPIDSVTGEEL